MWGHPEPQAQLLCKTKYVQKNKLYYFQKKENKKVVLKSDCFLLESEIAGLLI